MASHRDLNLKDAAPVRAKSNRYLVNRTILTGVTPSKWKNARVTPIFKAGARNDENNYQKKFSLHGNCGGLSHRS